MKEPWRVVFREGIAPQMPTEALEALRHGLLTYDVRLRPGATVQGFGPGPTYACAIGYGAWMGMRLTTADGVQEFFEGVCRRADEALGQPGACRHFIQWFDERRREVVFPQLLAEVNRVLAVRAGEQTDGSLVGQGAASSAPDKCQQ